MKRYICASQCNLLRPHHQTRWYQWIAVYSPLYSIGKLCEMPKTPCTEVQYWQFSLTQGYELWTPKFHSTLYNIFEVCWKTIVIALSALSLSSLMLYNQKIFIMINRINWKHTCQAEKVQKREISLFASRQSQGRFCARPFRDINFVHQDSNPGWNFENEEIFPYNGLKIFMVP